MKIAHVIGFFQPELGYEEYYLARKQVQLGHEVHMITTDRISPIPNLNKLLKQIGSKYKDRFRKTGIEEIDGIIVHRLPCIMESLYDFTIPKGMKKTLKEIDPDVVHAHGPRQGTSALPAIYKNIGYTLISDSHDYELHTSRFYRWEYLLFRRIVCKFAYMRSEKVIAVTRRTKEFLINIDKIKPSHIEEVPFGVERDLFYYHKKKGMEIRQKYNISKKDIVIVCCGTISIIKKLEYLIDVVQKLSKKHPNIKLMFVGDGDEAYMKKMKKRINRNCEPNLVFFTGFVPSSEVAYYYSASDIAVWPNYPTITVLEAMACRLPIIIPDRQLNHLVNYENGYIFPVGDKDVLYRRIQRLIINKKQRKKMGKKSQDAIDHYLSYDVIAKRILKIYKNHMK